MASTPIFSTGGGGPGFCCVALICGTELGAQVTKVLATLTDRAALILEALLARAVARKVEREAADLAIFKRELMLG